MGSRVNLIVRACLSVISCSSSASLYTERRKKAGKDCRTAVNISVKCGRTAVAHRDARGAGMRQLRRDEQHGRYRQRRKERSRGQARETSKEAAAFTDRAGRCRGWGFCNPKTRPLRGRRPAPLGSELLAKIARGGFCPVPAVCATAPCSRIHGQTTRCH